MSKGYILSCKKGNDERYYYYTTENEARDDIKVFKKAGYKVSNIQKCPSRCTVYTKDGPEA